MVARRLERWLTHARGRVAHEWRGLLGMARAEGPGAVLRRLLDVLAGCMFPARRAFVKRLEHERRLAQAFDEAFGVETTGEPALTEVGVPAHKARQGHGIYRGIGSGLFHAALRAGSLPVAGLTFVDYGSGKGKALLLAATYPFRRIVGVEYAPGLHAVAQRNLSVFHAPEQRCFTLDAERADALEWEPPAEPLLCFFFNPFTDDVLERVLERLADSWRRVPRDIFLLYVNIRDTHEQARVFEQCSELTLLRRDRHALLAKVTPQRFHAWRP